MKLCQFAPRARPWAVAVVAVALVAAGCSGSSKKATLGGKDPLIDVSAAMHKAASGHITGTTTGAKGAKIAPLDGEFDGGVTGEGDVNAVFVATSNGVKLPTELRWVDNVLYFTRSTTSVPEADTFSAFTRPATSKPWRAARLTAAGLGGVVRFLPAAFSPVALVDLLQAQHAQMTVHTGASVGSVKATRLTSTPVPVGLWLGATVNLWVDSKDRVVQVQITSPAGGAQYEVSKYGATVKVSPPPAAEIQTTSEVVAKVPSGPFVTVKSGTTNGANWALQRAPGTEGTECWRWQATPPLPQTGVTKPGDPECIPPTPTTSDDPTDLVTFVVNGKATGPYDALGVLLPPGVKKLTFGFVGGKTEQLTPDRVLVWVGPAEPTKAYLGVTLADGSRLDCGAGAVSSPDDLTDPQITANVAGAVWGCVPSA